MMKRIKRLAASALVVGVAATGLAFAGAASASAANNVLIHDYGTNGPTGAVATLCFSDAQSDNTVKSSQGFWYCAEEPNGHFALWLEEN